MNIEFYFDPSCPFSWITSRWILVASNNRDINVSWKPFSLALKNDELTSGDSPHRGMHVSAHRSLRVMLAAQQQHQASLIDMYTVAGLKRHVLGEDIDDAFISAVLEDQNLPAELLKAADDENYDTKLQDCIDEAVTIGGSDIGVPFIVFENNDGQKQGFFGPVLQTLPPENESLDLWDGLSKLATNKSFYELKRSRPGGGPDTASTANC